MTDYRIPTDTAHTEIEVKKSRFIAYIGHTPGVEEAKAFIQSLKEQYPDARHHCYGFIAGAPSDSNQYGFSDDNEPSGTAGMPIFTHLEHANVGETTIVVVRYFGGTKLGTGGLAKAYGDAAKAIMEQCELKTKILMRNARIQTPFAQEADVRRGIENADGIILNAQYSDEVVLEVEVPLLAEPVLPFQAQWLEEDSTT
ncbi:YigZ family protein [Bermanella marisrubri]|uniref:Impact N-terminal domain-containing protein n=1 Tax=Bermanella marisrubri TaxID=207949 RepID=Q1N4Z2_9GAMM|nr:YigZ family protein [Bermanella marisrubri]EAT13286.1 hypothetical protein RED65_00960 [Oceanobacter sp. RED65] [Bermanella marisrubri]QIZ84049.1 YigZ family protein [Bermanella marisrubri]